MKIKSYKHIIKLNPNILKGKRKQINTYEARKIEDYLNTEVDSANPNFFEIDQK